MLAPYSHTCLLVESSPQAGASPRRTHGTSRTPRTASLHPRRYTGHTEIDPLLWRPQTWGLTLQLFKSNRTDILKRGMSPDPVIEALHILEDGLPGLGTRMARK